MYTLSVSRSFVAQHFLTVPDPGPEGELHSHHYGLELEFSGPELDEYGYLLDIDDVEATAEAVVGTYRDETLNDLPAFDGLNPSVEHFARILGDDVAGRLSTEGADRLAVHLAEDDVARVSHTREL